MALPDINSTLEEFYSAVFPGKLVITVKILLEIGTTFS